MRHLGGLLPYSLAAAAAVLASAIALGATIRAPSTGIAGPTAGAEPTSAGTRATLSETGRMAYWRTNANGQLELWVSDLVGGRRWTVSVAAAGSDIALTRWSPDGGAVAYVVAGTTLAVARIEGGNAYLDIPGDLRTQRWRIVSYEWSPDGTRVAATLRAANGLSSVSDVYVTSVKAGSLWERITTLGDGFAGRWISATQLFIEEASGATLVLDVASKALRPITGMPVTSPQIGRDGRVYFVGGSNVAGDVSTQPFANGWVWSSTIDGDDLRRETKESHDQMRLFGLLADGRAVVGVPGGVYVAGDAYVPLTFPAGTVRRVVVSQDGRRAIGLTDQRILVIDAAKISSAALTALPPSDAVTVLLSSVREADVWFPAKGVTPARIAARVSEAPRAKLAFVLGRSIWQADAGGEIRAVASDPNGFLIGTPQWSPSGDRIAAAGGVAPGSTAVSVIGAAGVRRWEVPVRFPQGLGWSSDGTKVALWSSSAPRFDEFTTQLYDADSGRADQRIAGRATFVPAGTIVLSDGDLDPTQGVRVGQRVDLIGPAGTRAVTDARRLAAAPALRDLPDPALPSLVNQLAASADGRYVALWLYRVRGGGIQTGAVVVVRVADGEAIWAMRISPQGGPGDVAWSQSGHQLGWTIVEAPGTGAARRHAVAVDPVTGRTLLSIDGRLAGWAPVGVDEAITAGPRQFIYVARDDGLFAYATDGTGIGARVGPIGVPVAAAKP